MTDKKIRVGVDLDGVIVGKPFFIPKNFLEWLVRSHTNSKKKYRFPKLKAEIWIRKKSHHWLLRPAMRGNIERIKKIGREKKLELFIISGRYNFLKKKTQIWLKKHHLEKTFQQVFINQKNKQPHFFKEEMIKRLKLDHFFDDDPIVIDYLKKRAKRTRSHLVKGDNDPIFEIIKA